MRKSSLSTFYHLLQILSTPTISFSLSESRMVQLNIYNALGQQVRALVSGEHLESGSHQLVWDGRDAYGQVVSNGIYVYEMQAGDFRAVRKMLMLK